MPNDSVAVTAAMAEGAFALAAEPRDAGQVTIVE